MSGSTILTTVPSRTAIPEPSTVTASTQRRALLPKLTPSAGAGGEPSTPPYVNLLTKSSAVSQTSRQPLSIVSEWPRFGIFTISVTPSLRFCFL
jgi:hypothetical protein